MFLYFISEALNTKHQVIINLTFKLYKKDLRCCDRCMVLFQSNAVGKGSRKDQSEAYNL